MDLNKRIELVEEAKSLIDEAKSLVDEAVHGHETEGHYAAYGRYGFDDLLGNGNPYNSSLDTLLDQWNCEIDGEEYKG